MDSAKIKNIIITILVLLNIFMAATTIHDNRLAKQSEKAQFELVKAVLEKNNISLEKDVELRKTAPVGCTLVREGDIEQRNVHRIVGKNSREDLGGNIIYYNGRDGKASLRGTGEMDILLESERVNEGKDVVRTSIRTMEKLGIVCDKDLVDIIPNGGSTMVDVRCSWEGSPVYNAKLQLTFSHGNLLMISGTRIFDVKKTSGDKEPMNYYAAIIRFIELVNENGYVCSEITGFDAGYLMTVPVSGESVLTPVWRIQTDTGTYYINAENGRQETISA